MRILSLILTSTIFTSIRTAVSLQDGSQAPFSELDIQYPGYSLDLNERRLVQFEGEQPVWMTELEKINAKARGLKFFDITETQNLDSLASLASQRNVAYPKPNATEQVKAIISTLSTEGPKENLEHFSSFRTRYYRSETGQESQKWLLSKIVEITTKWGSESMQDRISFEEFAHSWGQNTIIVRINGSATADDGVVILSAHQDSTNLWPFLPAPGADDDGSGSVTILEAYRALVAADFDPVNAVEFHWYSAEEGGLLGSQAVAQDYATRSVQLIGVSHYDMTAWVREGTKPVIGIFNDYNSAALTDFYKQLVDAYIEIPYVLTKCGYACSDHASWTKAGYPAVASSESAMDLSNPNIHSANDRIDHSDEFSFDHMLEFSKLAVAFAVELGGWKVDN